MSTASRRRPGHGKSSSSSSRFSPRLVLECIACEQVVIIEHPVAKAIQPFACIGSIRSVLQILSPRSPCLFFSYCRTSGSILHRIRQSVSRCCWTTACRTGGGRSMHVSLSLQQKPGKAKRDGSRPSLRCVADLEPRQRHTARAHTHELRPSAFVISIHSTRRAQAFIFGVL